MNFVKRTMDIVASLIMLILLSPLFLVVFIVSLVSQGFPIFIHQERYGKGGETFKILKFRTMRKDAPTVASNEIKDEYITHWGKVLRKTSIDELPQLINVLKGDMSIVGPRPLVKEEEEIHKRRLKEGIYSVRPGITGWAQINGRDNLSIKEKVRLDKEYVEKRSVWFDIKIIFNTFVPVLKQSDIKQ